MIHQIVEDITTKGWSFQEKATSPEELKLISPLFAGDFRPAKVGHHDQKQRAEEIRGDWISWIDPLDPPEALKRHLQFLNELKTALNENFFLGLKEFECHLAKYPSGSFYRKHSDRFNNDSSRSVSFIWYMHEEWSSSDGGELVLYHKDGSILETILPAPGSMICFISEEFPHEVKVCHRERRSLTGWMHTKLLY